jgi:tryptophan 2,3-dioxygenase
MQRTVAAPHQLIDALASWKPGDQCDDFPYEAVLDCFHRHGRHFVPEPVLDVLSSVRHRLDPAPGTRVEGVPLAAFLHMALDKWDDRHCYASYLGVDLLGLTEGADGATAERERREWVALLLSDLRVFETRNDGDGPADDRFPEQRPAAALREKRLTLLDTALAAALPQELVDASGGVAGAAARLLADAPPEQAVPLALCMLPVYVSHDEYLFIRVLQTVEVTFAAMAAQLRDAVAAARRGDARNTAAYLEQCTGTLSGVRIVFSLLATMQPESFQTFRVYTVGASAIQSEAYKIFEALCSAPARMRYESPAFESVPRVRDLIREDWDDVTSVVVAAVSDSTMAEADFAMVRDAAQRLENLHQMWKQTHWKMARRMIGEQSGTGYTEGVPYLKAAIDNRLFAGLTDLEPGAARA